MCKSSTPPSATGFGGEPDGHGFRRPEWATGFSRRLIAASSSLFTSSSTIGCIATPPGRPSSTVAVPSGHLLEDFIAAGFDVLNPVQCSAAQYESVRPEKQVRRPRHFLGRGSGYPSDAALRLTAGSPRGSAETDQTFGPGGGFVFNAVHNIQALVPAENVLAMYEAAREFGRYPLSARRARPEEVACDL